MKKTDESIVLVRPVTEQGYVAMMFENSSIELEGNIPRAAMKMTPKSARRIAVNLWKAAKEIDGKDE